MRRTFQTYKQTESNGSSPMKFNCGSFFWVGEGEELEFCNTDVSFVPNFHVSISMSYSIVFCQSMELRVSRRIR